MTDSQKKAPAALEIDGLHKRFGELRAVDGVDLTIESGRVTAVIGPNGAGKSTLFNLVTRRIEADRGQVRFRGKDITSESPDRITRMGLARSFQISSVFPELSVRENILVAVLAQTGRANVLRRRLVRETSSMETCEAIISRLDLHALAALPCRTLGYGDRRRVEVGMVLALQPSLVLLDEPTAGMGTHERRATAELFKQLVDTGSYTFVLTEHDVDLVFDVAERVVVMHQGKVISDGRPDEVADDPAVRSAYLGEAR